MTPCTTELLATTLRLILPPDVKVAALDVASVELDAIPAALTLEKAGTKRRREFAAGRIAASQAIEACGLCAAFPGTGSDRQPLWPDGLVGSITHTDHYAIAAATDAAVTASIGIDLEVSRALNSEVGKTILTRRERESLQRAHACDDDSVLRFFSFKESIYKAVFPIYGHYIDFREVEIYAADYGLRAQCTDRNHPASELVARIQGDVKRIEDFIVAGCWMT